MRCRLPALRILLGAALLLCQTVISICCEANADEVADAKQILERCEAVYKNCTWYQDSGTIDQDYLGIAGPHTATATFATQFMGPKQFLFEYTADYELEIQSDDDGVTSKVSTRNGIQQHAALNDALSTYLGITGTISKLIPRMLMPESVSGSRLTREHDFIRSEDCLIEGDECFCLVSDDLENATTIWLRKSDFLIVKLEFLKRGRRKTISIEPQTRRREEGSNGTREIQRDGGSFGATAR